MDYADDTFRLPDLTGQAHGGGVTGTATINNQGAIPSYQASLKFSGLDLLTLMKDFGANPEFIQGKIDLTCDLEGSLKQPAIVSGKGAIETHDTQLTGLKALDALGSMLNLPQLRYNKFDSIKGTFKVSDEQVTIYDLEAISSDLKMTGTGRIGFDRSVDFDILLILSPDLARKIPAASAAKFSLRDDGGSSITFKLNRGRTQIESCRETRHHAVVAGLGLNLLSITACLLPLRSKTFTAEARRAQSCRTATRSSKAKVKSHPSRSDSGFSKFQFPPRRPQDTKKPFPFTKRTGRGKRGLELKFRRLKNAQARSRFLYLVLSRISRLCCSQQPDREGIRLGLAVGGSSGYARGPSLRTPYARKGSLRPFCGRLAGW